MSKSESSPFPRRRVIAVVAVLATTALAVVLIYPLITAKRDPEKVRVGYVPLAAELPIFVGVEQSVFSKHGVEVELVRFESSAVMGTAFVNGEIEVMGSVATTVALSIESRDPGTFLIIMLDANTPASPLSAMLTMPDSGIGRVEDLRGKKVGIFPGPTAPLMFGLVMKKHGLDPAKDLTLVELPPASQLPALVGGQVAALCTYEPIGTQGVVDHNAVNFHPAPIEREVVNPNNGGVSCVSRKFIAARPDKVRRLVAALDESLDFVRANPTEAKKSLQRYTNIAPHVIAKMECNTFWKLGEVDRAVFQRYADITHEGGLISKRIDISTLLFDPVAAGVAK